MQLSLQPDAHFGAASSNQQQGRLLKQVFQRSEELGAAGTVEDAVVTAERHRELIGEDLAVFHESV